MKLSAEARDYLRSLLRSHPKTTEIIEKVSTISRMKKAELLDLANKVDINVQSIIDLYEAKKEGNYYFTKDEKEIMDYTEKNPAFVGELPFDLNIEMFGHSFTVKAKAVYEYTPEWEYFDLNKKRLMEAWAMSRVYIKIQAEPEVYALPVSKKGHRYKKIKKKVWLHSKDLMSEGVIPQDIWIKIDEKLDEECTKEDKMRRKEHLTDK